MKIGLFHGSKLDQIYLCSIDKSWEKGDFENLKVINQSPNSMVFSIVRFTGGTKTVLSGNPL